jgi:hypothetical protein
MVQGRSMCTVIAEDAVTFAIRPGSPLRRGVTRLLAQQHSGVQMRPSMAALFSDSALRSSFGSGSFEESTAPRFEIGAAHRWHEQT